MLKVAAGQCEPLKSHGGRPGRHARAAIQPSARRGHAADAQHVGSPASVQHQRPPHPRAVSRLALSTPLSSIVASHPPFRGQQHAVPTAIRPAGHEWRADATPSAVQPAPVSISKWRDAAGADALERRHERARWDDALPHPSAGYGDGPRKRSEE